MTSKTAKQFYTQQGKVGRQLDQAMRNEKSQPYHTDACGSCRMIHGANDSCKIPAAPYYVCSNDTFMSGWGNARNMINVCVVPCATMQEALAVESYVAKRTDQKYIRIVGEKPRSRGRKLSLLLEWRYHATSRNVPMPKGK